MTDTPKTSWRIEAGRVGPVELGKALPAELLAGDLESRYLARYIADGQPVDGFQYDEPPVLVLVEDGPFSNRIEKTKKYEDPPVAELRGPGAKAARGGATVKTIMIMGAGPATEAGVGVGSTLEALKAAYADLRLWPFPETLGADMCTGKTKSLPGVVFVFATCAKANKGEPVKRIDVSLPSK